MPVSALHALSDDGPAVSGGQGGSLSVAIKRTWSGDGGANGVRSSLRAARFGLPLADAAGPGRVIPALRQLALHLAKNRAASVTDVGGNAVLVDASDDIAADRLAWAIMDAMPVALRTGRTP